MSEQTLSGRFSNRLIHRKVTSNARLVPIARNIDFYHNDQTDAAAVQVEGATFRANQSVDQRKLVILMSWLEAKEKHIVKYRKFYLDRGFDVLSVKTSASDIILPGIGPQQISRDFIKFMAEKQYSNVMIHGFSVAGFMWSQVLLELDRRESEVRKNLLNSIRGCIFDSLITAENVSVGVANGVTRNKILAKVYESLMKVYLVVGYRIATRHYIAGTERIWSGLSGCRALFFMSRDDVIADQKVAMKLSEAWRSKGIDSRDIVVDGAPHVQIFKTYPERYVKEVENFLKLIKLD